LKHECNGSNFTYLGDEERLDQLVVNLGANAIRFSPRGGRVLVWLTDATTEFELQVEDTGVGIPPRHCEYLRSLPTDTPRSGGTGLGLAIVEVSRGRTEVA
jgi:signal transduction histidine kinase